MFWQWLAICLTEGTEFWPSTYGFCHVLNKLRMVGRMLTKFWPSSSEMVTWCLPGACRNLPKASPRPPQGRAKAAPRPFKPPHGVFQKRRPAVVGTTFFSEPKMWFPPQRGATSENYTFDKLLPQQHAKRNG